jgi:hypothetical protein
MEHKIQFGVGHKKGSGSYKNVIYYDIESSLDENEIKK